MVWLGLAAAALATSCADAARAPSVSRAEPRPATSAGEAALPTLEAAPWPEPAPFRATGTWLGADSAYSIDLGPRRVLWLFGDTFIDPLADGSRDNGPNFFVRNSVAIQTGPDDESAHDPSRSTFSYHVGPTTGGVPSSFFPDVDGGKSWLWPLHGVRLASGQLLLFRMRITAVSGGLGFGVSGWDAVAIDEPDAEPSAWKPRVVMPLTVAAQAHERLLGVSVTTYKEHLYVYAVGNDPQKHPVYLARYPLKELSGLRAGALSDPEWWTGRRGFVRQSEGAPPECIIAEGQVELSVSYSERLRRFVEIQTRGGLLGDARTALVARFAPAPEGPWSEPVAFHRPVEATRADAASLITYAAKAHPEQRVAGAPGDRRAETLVVSYVVNDLRHPTPGDALYYPKLLRLRLSPR